MELKKKLAFFGVILLSSGYTLLTSAYASRDDWQNVNIPRPQSTSVSPITPAISGPKSDPNYYVNYYSAVNTNPVNMNQLNTNYQPPLNPASSINTDAANLATWNSAYATGNYGVTQDISQGEFATASPSDFAEAQPLNAKVEIPQTENIRINNPRSDDFINR
jgi:hypothetical protein